MIPTPSLPLDSESEMLLSCKSGFVNVGGKNATCVSGEIKFKEEEEPLCLTASKYLFNFYQSLLHLILRVLCLISGIKTYLSKIFTLIRHV